MSPIRDQRCRRVRAVTVAAVALGAAIAGTSTAASAEREGRPALSHTVRAETPSVDEKRHAFLWRDGKMIDLGTLGGRESLAFALNEAGQVVGWAETRSGRHAFLWEHGKMRDLGTLASPRSRLSQGYAINDRGQVAGDTKKSAAWDAASGHGFFWERGRMTDLGTLGGAWSESADIDAAGRVVGYSALPDGSRHAFMWRRGRLTDLGTLGGESLAWAVNDRGQVVGSSQPGDDDFHAFLWQDGTMSDLGTLGGDESSARAINERGQIVGSSTYQPDSYDRHAFLWQDGTIRDLGTLGGTESRAAALNERGQVVGTSETAKGDEHAFLWQDGRMRDLGTLGGNESTAVAINERGQIVGTSTTRRGRLHAFLWQQGRMRDLGTLGGAMSGPTAISDRGEIVGVSTVPGDLPPAMTATTIAYTRPVGDTLAIYTMRTEGSHRFRLSPTDEPGWSPAWSPDGREVAYSDGYSIRIAHTVGRGARTLGFGGDGCGPEGSGSVGQITWSPDGRKIAFSCGWDTYADDGEGMPTLLSSSVDLYAMDVRTKRVRRLTRTPAAYEHDPSWSPDGRRIAFSDSRIFVLDLSTRQTRRIGAGFAPDWSPDGSRIVYATAHTIGVMNADGSRSRTILRSPRYLGMPSWAPDGRRVVYNEWPRLGRPRLYVVATDGSGRRLLGDGVDADWRPR